MGTRHRTNNNQKVILGESRGSLTKGDEWEGLEGRLHPGSTTLGAGRTAQSTAPKPPLVELTLAWVASNHRKTGWGWGDGSVVKSTQRIRVQFPHPHRVAHNYL